MNTYVAFLRGINVGGNKKVPMATLKQLLSKLGFKQVQTLLNSGNVIFQTDQKNLKQSIETAIKAHFGFEVATQVIAFAEIEKILKKQPFKNSLQNKNHRHYVTFVQDKEPIFSVVDLGSKNTIDLMSKLEKEHGKNITTRNWNTLERIGKLKG